ncbi:DISARM system phospholipase D-like protein DrmC [Pseudomonas putida]|uniref:DISARM system phospholipase D-like protein DrmC n=1 Tax=Pseudomonas putida TaxID=303 RepID=UPI002979E2AE|nr:DISARM system phospholipase D-like protein DrmC [Pseudomonas putida]MCC9007524.1 DISARM system phospholipase D-like protein DrmC [Pseudomonas putida]
MDELLDAIAAVVCLVSPEKVQAIASRIRRTDTSKASSALSGVVGTPTAAGLLDQLINAWRASAVSAEELASMLLASGYVLTKAANQQSTELVWTGPTTPFVSARRTEQALLQVINAAEKTLFITSFVAYDVSTIVKALNAASDRGVVISMLLELSQDHGGSIAFDAIGKMRSLVPAAKLYAWREKADPFSDGRVHAKVAVADGKMCFITSANLTGHAMEKNIEAGVLISGDPLPGQVNRHLEALAMTGVIVPADA